MLGVYVTRQLYGLAWREFVGAWSPVAFILRRDMRKISWKLWSSEGKEGRLGSYYSDSCSLRNRHETIYEELPPAPADMNTSIAWTDHFLNGIKGSIWYRHCVIYTSWLLVFGWSSNFSSTAVYKIIESVLLSSRENKWGSLFFRGPQVWNLLD